MYLIWFPKLFGDEVITPLAFELKRCAFDSHEELLNLTRKKSISHRSTESHGVSPGTLVSPTGKVEGVGQVIQAHSN